MIKTAANIIKGLLKKRNHSQHEVEDIGWVQEKILKHQDDQIVKKTRIKNLVIFYKRPYELLHAYREIFVNEIYCFTSTNPAPLIIDCGSNIGLSVLFFKKLFPAATVHAFEPDENNFKLLQKNIEANNQKNVVLNKAAVWIAEGEISFESNESEASHISTEAAGVRVKSICLKNYLEPFEQIDFLKIDIEGAEAAVIQDCSLHLHKVQNLFLEYHGKVEDSLKLAVMLQTVEAAGFHIYIRNAADALKRPFAEKRTNTMYDVQLNLFCYR